MIKNVGILSPGDMGSAVGRALKQNGFNVFATLKNRSDRTRLLSQSAGISSLDSLGDLTKTCDVTCQNVFKADIFLGWGFHPPGPLD